MGHFASGPLCAYFLTSPTQSFSPLLPAACRRSREESLRRGPCPEDEVEDDADEPPPPPPLQLPPPARVTPKSCGREISHSEVEPSLARVNFLRLPGGLEEVEEDTKPSREETMLAAASSILDEEDFLDDEGTVCFAAWLCNSSSTVGGSWWLILFTDGTIVSSIIEVSSVG